MKFDAEPTDTRCRCGGLASLDISIAASRPFELDTKAHRPELHVSSVACRSCAFEAAQLLLSFLETQRGQES